MSSGVSSSTHHFLSLDGLIYVPDRRVETERVFCISGFVVSVRDEWFFITAGHIFDEVEEARKQGQIIESWTVDCSYSMHAKDNIGTHFGLEDAQPIHYYDSESGLDYAFVFIRPLTRLNLEANGLTALDEQAWRRNLPDDFDEYFLLGIPAESVSYDAETKQVTKVLTIAPMDELQELPLGVEQKEGLFFARLHDVPADAVNAPNSIKGMSGGPIFGLKHGEDKSKYWVVAIQSWWKKDERILRACYLRVLCEWLEEYGPPQQAQKRRPDPSRGGVSRCLLAAGLGRAVRAALRAGRAAGAALAAGAAISGLSLGAREGQTGDECRQSDE